MGPPRRAPLVTRVILSRRQIKAADRVGGINLLLPWPAGLPAGRPVAPDHEREATPAEQHGLVPVHVRAANVCRPPDWPGGRGYEMRLAVTIIGRRWVHATGDHDPPDMWVRG